MSSRDHTTSVKLDERTRAYLGAIAKQRNRSVHSLLKEAIQQFCDRDEAIEREIYLSRNATIEKQFLGEAKRTLPAPPKGLPERIAKQIAEGNNRLRVLRGWRGMNLGRLATALADMGVDVDERTLAAIEEDRLRPSPALAAVLARALRVKVGDVMG